MSEQTANLALPFILPSQAQKHVTHNEALQRLDALVQLTITDESAAPPEDAAEGACYLVAAGASGIWTGKGGMLAVWQDGAWLYLSPKAGWCGFFTASGQLRSYDGAAWNTVSFAGDGSVPMIGINATPDAVNRLSVASEASLFSHVGNGHQLKVNKESASDTGSLLFQTAWSGRAEMGLAGNDEFSIKVSNNGTDWQTALHVSQGGVVRTPARPIVRASRSPGTATPATGSRSGFDDMPVLQGGFTLGAAVSSGAGSRLLVPASGLYLLSLCLRTLSSSGHTASIEKNGTTVLGTAEGTVSTNPAQQSIATVSWLDEGDWLTILHTGAALYEFGPAKTELFVIML